MITSAISSFVQSLVNIVPLELFPKYVKYNGFVTFPVMSYFFRSTDQYA